MRKRPLTPNDRGLVWDKDRTVYHATIALRAIVDGGFKTRAQMSLETGEDEVHAVGAGTSHAISFTLDRRVAEAIVVGLRTLRRGVRGEIGLGDIIIQARECAPQGLDGGLNQDRLTPEEVEHFDAGLLPVGWGATGYSRRGTSMTQQEMESFTRDPRSQIKWEQFAGATKPYLASGWVPRELLIAAKPDESYWLANRSYFYSLYKAILAFGEFANEVYDPFFMSTRLDILAELDEDDIGIVSAKIGADWLCTEPNYAEKLVGYNEAERIAGSRGYAWAQQCQGHLDALAKGRDWTFDKYTKPVREWDDPSPDDTVAYLSHTMAELRVWNPALIQNVRREADVDDVVYETGVSWFNRAGKEIDGEPYFYPHFKPMRGRS
jgi:hypothetical protein